MSWKNVKFQNQEAVCNTFDTTIPHPVIAMFDAVWDI